MAEKENPYRRLWEQIRSYVSLRIESSKLSIAEKATVLITTAALAIIGFMLFVAIMFFISVGLANLLADAVGNIWANFIVAGGYLLLLIIVILLRGPLIMTPLARFITKLFFSK